MNIKVKYHDPDMPKLEFIGGVKSDWIDLRVAESATLKKDDIKRLSLGVSMKLPEGYEALIAPRSSLCSKFGVMQTNSIGIIDNTYSGDNDIWQLEVIAVRDTTINKGERLCQFRLIPSMGAVTLEEVDHLGGKDRGGFGSTGVN